MINKNKQERIAIEVIKTLYKRFLLFPTDAKNNRNAPFHEAFLKAFKEKLNNKVQDIPYFISLASWLHGLNTTLGQSFFENVAHILSDGEKKDFKQANNNLPNIYSEQIQSITEIIADLKNGTHTPSLSRETAILEKTVGKGDLKEGTQFTVDVFYEDASEVTAVELKTVKPNAGEMRGEKQKILEGKASLKRSFPTKTIKYYIGFPFDPNIDRTINNATDYNKDSFLSSIIDGKKYFDPDEILLSSELWDFLSSESNTMDLILEIINKIATPDFYKQYRFIQQNENRQTEPENYLSLLENWYLFSEIELLTKDKLLRNKLLSKSDQRNYNKTVFHETSSANSTNYNWSRFYYLQNFLFL